MLGENGELAKRPDSEKKKWKKWKVEFVVSAERWFPQAERWKQDTYKRARLVYVGKIVGDYPFSSRFQPKGRNGTDVDDFGDLWKINKPQAKFLNIDDVLSPSFYASYLSAERLFRPKGCFDRKVGTRRISSAYSGRRRPASLPRDSNSRFAA